MTIVMKETCAICAKKAGIVKCQGCEIIFRRDDLNTHRNKLDEQFEEFADELNTFQQTASQASADSKSSMVCHINNWEMKSIQTIKQAAERARQQVEEMAASSDEENAAGIREIVEQLHENRQCDAFDERDLMRWKERLHELRQIVLKPYISVNEQQAQSPFVTNIYVNEQDIFNQACGHVCIQEEGQLACHKFNLFGSDGEIRGKREYFIGIHRIRLKIAHLDNYPWWFFGIISKITPMQPNSCKSPSAYGWAGHNEVYMNGQRLQNMTGYTSDYLKEDIIELILDCDRRLIRMNNLRSTKSHEIVVDLAHCPFPWMVHLNLFHIQTRIRINP